MSGGGGGGERRCHLPRRSHQPTGGTGHGGRFHRLPAQELHRDSEEQLQHLGDGGEALYLPADPQQADEDAGRGAGAGAV